MNPLNRNLRAFGCHWENSAVGAYRLWSPLDELKRQGLMDTQRFPDAMKFAEVPIDRMHKTARYDGMSFEEIGEWADIMVWQRFAAPEHVSLVYALREMFGNPVVAECDDDMFSVEPTGNAFMPYSPKDPAAGLVYHEVSPEDLPAMKQRKSGLLVKRDGKDYFVTDESKDKRKWAEIFFKEADGVTTTTETLANVFRQYNPYVYVLPNCLDFKVWDAAKAKQKVDDKFHVCWFGGMQHFDDLKIIANVIPWMLDKYPQTVFHMTPLVPSFWDGMEEKYPGRFLHHEFAPIQIWPEFLATINLSLALAPLNSARFNMSKSNIKLLEFGALGVPTIFSPVGPYTEVEDNAFGWLAATEDQWKEKISEAIEDSVTRICVGDNACAYVHARYDITKNIHLWREAYEEIYNRSHKMRLKASARLRQKMLGSIVKT